MTLLIHVSKVTVIRQRHGADHITFKFDGPTPFPKMQQAAPTDDYSPYLSVTVQKGYAEEWLALLGIDRTKVEILDVNHEVHC